ncbi:hypothetical protein BDF14DRAFT_1734412 [Spinellus fusiger]|nr:hypothetical protein BDF14DRAFT_1734412 [Spinellus fusiger]
MDSVVRLVEKCQRFFEPCAAREILEEFLPHFTTHSVADAIQAQGYIALFLPVAIQRHSITNEYLNTTAMSPKEYLPTLFSMWSIFTCSLTYDTQFTDLVSRIAEHNITKGENDIGLFTKQQVQTVFTVCLRMMNLPVGSHVDGNPNSAGSGSTGYKNDAMKIDMKANNSLFIRRKLDKLKPLSRFIVYTMLPETQPDGTETSFTLSCLGNLIQASELYFHPSNHGHWSYQLSFFICYLAHEFVKRWKEEQEQDCKTPMECRFTPHMRKTFVLLLRPVIYLSLFGKDQYIVLASQAAITSLSWLEPDLVFPGLFERIYPSLETLTETHRTSGALSILSEIALPMLTRDHYPAGGKHLLPLLHLAIPGIDLNDPMKTMGALMFITNALMTVPVFDLIEGGSYHHPSMDSQMLCDDMQPGKYETTQLPREVEDQLCRTTTGEFEEWLAKFLRRVFTIFENLPQHDRKKQGGATETGIVHMLLRTCDIVFGQLSDTLYDLALKMVLEFVNDQVYPNAIRATGLLCDSIASVNVKKASKHFIPLCISNIRSELAYNASSTITNSASSPLIPSDATFHWYQNILFSVVSTMGTEALVYKTDLFAIAGEMVSACRSRRGIMWTGKFLRNLLRGLLQTYPKDYRSLTPTEWNTKELMDSSHLLWGKLGDPKNLQVDWHTPNNEEIDMAMEVLDTFLVPSLVRLKVLMEEDVSVKISSAHQLTNEFCRHLALIRNCIMGSCTMVKDDGVDEQTVSNISESDEESMYCKTKKLVAGYALTDPNDSRTKKAEGIRKSTGEAMHQVAMYFKAHREDDIESIKIFIKITRAFLSERGVEKGFYERSKTGYNYAKRLSNAQLKQKSYPRNLLVHRAYNHHLLRLRQNCQGRARTELHDHLFQDILDLSLSSYPDIRTMSQSALSTAARHFVGVKYMILPTVLDALQKKEVVDTLTHSHRMKGSLYLLTHKPLLMICLRDWNFVTMFVLAICRAQHEDKLSIQELIRRVFVDYVSNYNTFSFRSIVSDDIHSSLDTLCSSEDIKEKTTVLTAKVFKKQALQVRSYHELMASLLEIMNDPKVHWRYATMAANFLELFLRPDMAPTVGLAAFANQCTLSELPPLRRIGVGATIQMLLYIKQRSLAQGDDDLLIRRKTRHPLKREQAVGNNGINTTQQLLEASCQTIVADTAAQSLLVDKTATGWYVWGKTYTAYEICTDEAQLPSVEDKSQAAYEELKKAFVSKEYWTKMSGYLSQETSQTQEDVFSLSHARLFTSIFQAYREAPLEAAKETLESLCCSFDQKNQQRAAAEVLAGLIRGMKHWPVAELTKTWAWLFPLLQKTFASITPDSLTYWESFVKFCATNRDPRRIRPLIDLILRADFDPTSDAAFSESTKLLLVCKLMTCLRWRLLPLCGSLLDTYLDHLQHPYKQVREVLGGNINELLQIQWVPALPCVEALLSLNARDGRDGTDNVPTSLSEQGQDKRIQQVITHLDTWLVEAKTDTSTHYVNASKTVLCWLYEALKQWRVAGTLPCLLSFLPRLFYMQEVNDDQDLQHMTTSVLHRIVQVSYPLSMVLPIIDQFMVILKTSPNWHSKVRALPALQIFFFKHLFSMTHDQILSIMQVVSEMLLDPQIEVRQMAAVTLGGLVRCSQREAIASLRQHFSTLLETHLPKRKRDAVTGKAIVPVGFDTAMLRKHAGALGLSCLVNAFPYEVPPWMPSILCELAGCISDPAEIQATVRKTFSDFRRTHSDAWHEDMTKFTQDQLSLLSDMLISPSYYA